jgi:hypothetical protein
VAGLWMIICFELQKCLGELLFHFAIININKIELGKEWTQLSVWSSDSVYRVTRLEERDTVNFHWDIAAVHKGVSW